MQYSRTTQVPNVLFDCYLKTLKLIELKILLVIIRKTLGWEDRRTVGGRKEIDWISTGQLQSLTGGSRRAISAAIEVLVREKYILVFDEQSNLLLEPQMRKGKQRMYFRLSGIMQFDSVDNVGKTGGHPLFTEVSCAHFAQGLSKKVTGLAQKMRITKETLQN